MVQYFTQSQDGTLSMPYLTEVSKVGDVEGTSAAVKCVACSELQCDGAEWRRLRENCTVIPYLGFIFLHVVGSKA